MRLSGIKGLTGRQSRFALPDQAASAPQAEPSRALVALSAPANFHEAPSRYLQAPFLAQLLAARDDHPQTRERRRGEPSEALAAYTATVNRAG